MGKRMLAVLACLLLMVGCLKSRSEYALLEDGRGKVVFQMNLPLDQNLGGITGTHEQQARQHVRSILEESAGVTAWEEVTYQVGDDNRLQFRGTAYFDDLEQLSLGGNVKTPTPGLRFRRVDEQRVELRLELDEAEEQQQVEPLQDQARIEQTMKTIRDNFDQHFPVMERLLAGMYAEMIFRMPGRIEQAEVVEQLDATTVRLVIDGDAILERFKTSVQDDDWLRRAVMAGMTNDNMPDALRNELVLGQAGQARVVSRIGDEHAFDYDRQVAAAKANQQRMVEQLRLAVSGQDASPTP